MTEDSRAGSPSTYSMKDVASTAGVSLQTVSNYINGRLNHLGPETQIRVRAAIEELRYVPNRAAQSLRNSSTRTLGFYVADSSPRFLGDPMTSLFLAGLGDQVRDDDYGLLVQSGAPSVSTAGLVRQVAEGRLDGMIVSLSGSAPRRRAIAEKLSQLDIPLILLQEHSLSEGLLACVSAEDREGSRSLCEHLIELGHTRIGFVTAASQWSAIEQRIMGYHDALREHGIPARKELVLRYGDFGAADAHFAAMQLLGSHDPPTAILCGNDLLALGVIQACNDLGLRVPDDVAVTGFDDFNFASAVEPSITTVRIDGYEMGRYAASALIRSVQSGTHPVGKRFDIEVCIRRSTAAVRDA